MAEESTSQVELRWRLHLKLAGSPYFAWSPARRDEARIRLAEVQIKVLPLHLMAGLFMSEVESTEEEGREVTWPDATSPRTSSSRRPTEFSGVLCSPCSNL